MIWVTARIIVLPQPTLAKSHIRFLDLHYPTVPVVVVAAVRGGIVILYHLQQNSDTLLWTDHAMLRSSIGITS